MTLKFFFGKPRQDNTCALRIRFKVSEIQDQKITIRGIAIQPKLWDSNLNRVKPNHPAYKDINEKIDKYEKKMREVAEKWRIGNINFETACRMMSSSTSMSSIRDFISQLNTIDDVKRTTITNYNNAINAFSLHTGIEEPLFSDINYSNVITLRKSLKKLGRSPETHKAYLRNLKSICSSALNHKIIFEKPDFNQNWDEKSKKIKTPRSIIPQDILDSINRIELDSNYKRTRERVIREFESVGLWLLMFSMRGMYPSDINDISVKNLDYNYESKIKAELKNNNSKGSVSLRWNPFIYFHHRHKTEVPMRILLNTPPIRKIIMVLRYLVSAAHPIDAFQSDKESRMKNYRDRISINKPNEIDSLKIFKFTSESDPHRFKDLWSNYNKKLRDIGMPNFKSARSTFMTTSTSLDIPQSIGRAMLGHSDPTISSHYNNFDDPRLFIKVTQAHLKVLYAFEIIPLFNAWLGRIDNLFRSNWLEVYGYKEHPYNLYENFSSKTQEMISITHTKV